jgi:hypothetical protein
VLPPEIKGGGAFGVQNRRFDFGRKGTRSPFEMQKY